ncbi:hypothetical protein [Mycoplasma mycoides]|uniref:AbiJ-related protein n=1 Tax=Mycoplasma mycoides TaxID=2102 RepID=UPI000771AC8B|nr:hypothetical protein [Mycoplasma mycoides]AMK56433.1 hypothetical protein MSCT144_05290 [Mycoplasma mycoides subsp. mycoides]QKK61127.1 hypothetical protein HR079_02415 [Mycoplasma mycoides]
MRKITKYTRKYILDVVKNGFWEKRFGIWKFYRYSYNGKLDYKDFLYRIYNFDTINNKTGKILVTKKINWSRLTKNCIFNDSNFKLIEFSPIYNKFDGNKNKGNEVDPLLIFLCEIFHPEVRREEVDWSRLFKKINSILSIEGITLRLTDEGNCIWEESKKRFFSPVV